MYRFSTRLPQLTRVRAPTRVLGSARAYSSGGRKTEGLGHVLLGTGIGVVFTGLWLNYTSTSPSPSHPTSPPPSALVEESRADVPITDPPTGTSVKISSENLARELQDALGDVDRVSTDPEVLHVHGYSENDYHPGSPPTVVVYPLSTADVVQIVNISRKHKIPITTYGGGTSLEGHWRAPPGGAICVDMSRMDKILEIHEEDSDLVCQPGIGWMDINAELKRRGIPLFFPIDPAPGASIGGMISTGCSGTNAVRYGTAKGEWFLNITVVLPSGEVIKTRRRSRKSSAGFDTTKLFIGAEGTLGIITEVTIKLAPVLPTTVAVVQFPDVRHATEAAREIVNAGVGIQCIELCDNEFMRSTNLYGQSLRQWPEQDSLFLKFQGPSAASLQEAAEISRTIAEQHGGTGFALAANDQEATALWADRKNALYSGLALVPGSRGWSTDVCVPVGRLPQLVLETKADIESSGLVCTIVGHVGDGNFHALLLFKTDAELDTARELVHRMVERAIRLDGTCTGEHGVGIGKREYLYDELGAGTVGLMKTIKRALDPDGLFNPGKLYPDEPNSDPQTHLVVSHGTNGQPSP